MTKEKPQKKKSLNPFVRFSGIAFQIGLTIYLGSEFGKWLDEKFPNSSEIYTKGMTLFAVFIAMYSVISQVKKMSK